MYFLFKIHSLYRMLQCTTRLETAFEILELLSSFASRTSSSAVLLEIGILRILLTLALQPNVQLQVESFSFLESIGFIFNSL